MGKNINIMTLVAYITISMQMSEFFKKWNYLYTSLDIFAAIR